MEHLIKCIDKSSKLLVACSGGPDSLALLHMLKHHNLNVIACFIDHNTETSKLSKCYVQKLCDSIDVKLVIHEINELPLSNKECFWRDQRRSVFETYIKEGYFIVTAHHLNDQVENYVMSMVNGYTHIRLMKFENRGYIKPLLLCTKNQLLKYCSKKRINFYSDPTNFGTDNARAKLRTAIIPNLLLINPGLESVVKRMTKQYMI